MEGDDCRLITELEAKYRDFIDTDVRPENRSRALKLHRVLRAFKYVRSKSWRHPRVPCPDWKQLALNFRDAWIASGMSVTTKAHMIWCCLPQMMEIDGHPYQTYGPLYYDEDWAESVHQDFFNEKYTGNERTAHKILRCIARYNYYNTKLE